MWVCVSSTEILEKKKNMYSIFVDFAACSAALQHSFVESFVLFYLNKSKTQKKLYCN